MAFSTWVFCFMGGFFSSYTSSIFHLLGVPSYFFLYFPHPLLVIAKVIAKDPVFFSLSLCVTGLHYNCSHSPLPTTTETLSLSLSNSYIRHTNLSNTLHFQKGKKTIISVLSSSFIVILHQSSSLLFEFSTNLSFSFLLFVHYTDFFLSLSLLLHFGIVFAHDCFGFFFYRLVLFQICPYFGGLTICTLHGVNDLSRFDEHFYHTFSLLSSFSHFQFGQVKCKFYKKAKEVENFLACLGFLFIYWSFFFLQQKSWKYIS